MQMDISPEIEGMIAARLAHGLNRSAEEVLREAVYLLAERDQFWQQNRTLLDGKIQTAMEEMARGEGLTEAQSQQHREKRRRAFFSA